MKILRTFNSCLNRQVNEDLRIIIKKADIVLNSKSEFRQAPIIRAVPTTGRQEEQEGSRSYSWGRGQGVGARGLVRGRGFRGRGFRGRGGDRRDTRRPG